MNDPHHWRDDALCRDFPQRWWFPEQGGAYQAALFVCSGCPSREPCLRYAIDNDITHGIWGGETESKRRAMRRAERKKRAAGGGGHGNNEPRLPADKQRTA